MKRIAVTGAAGQIAYSLLFRLASGEVFGNEQLTFQLLDLPGTEKALEGVAMELDDCSFPLLKEIRIGTDPFQMFENVNIALLVGAKPRGPGMERADLLMDNGKIFIEQGRALNESAHKHAVVMVVGNPCNTNCLIALHHAPNLNPKNFHAMMRLDQNRGSSLLAKKAQVEVKEVSRMTIWGNHSSTQVPDFVNALISGKKVTDAIKDLKWLQEDFIATVQQRGAQVIAARGKSSAASAASALLDSLKSLFSPTPQGNWFTSGVLSDQNPYGIEKDLIFGFPCLSKGKGDYEIVADLNWDFFLKEKIAVTQRELISERECVQNLIKRS